MVRLGWLGPKVLVFNKIIPELQKKVLTKGVKVLVLLFRRVLESYPVSTHYKCMIFQVSWLRRRGGEDVPVLLTFGESVYVSDVRFSIRRGSHEDWILDLLHVKSTDEALYECQVSTEPPQIHKIFLAVEGKHDCFFLCVCLTKLSMESFPKV